MDNSFSAKKGSIAFMFYRFRFTAFQYGLVLILLLLCIGKPSQADAWTLPENTKFICDEAFYACTTLTNLEIPQSVQSIGANAFAKCSALRQVTIPSSVRSIGAGAFTGSDYPLLIRTVPGSVAAAYALESGIDFHADTVYRALLIGQSNYQRSSVLKGALSDVQNMQIILSSFFDTPYEVTTRTDLTGTEITEAIRNTFSQAQEQDVSLVFYSGHGSQWGGALCGIDETTVSAQDLRACMDEIPGRKIVIVDACYSGALIGKSTENSSFITDFLSAFQTQQRSTTLAANRYYVMAAAHSTQTSAEITQGSLSYGAFTLCLVKGCGYDYLNNSACYPAADSNADGTITFYEAFRYARIHANSLNAGQTAQIWPDNSNAFGFLR